MELVSTFLDFLPNYDDRHLKNRSTFVVGHFFIASHPRFLFHTLLLRGMVYSGKNYAPAKSATWESSGKNLFWENIPTLFITTGTFVKVRVLGTSMHVDATKLIVPSPEPKSNNEGRINFELYHGNVQTTVRESSGYFYAVVVLFFSISKLIRQD